MVRSIKDCVMVLVLMGALAAAAPPPKEKPTAPTVKSLSHKPLWHRFSTGEIHGLQTRATLFEIGSKKKQKDDLANRLLRKAKTNEQEGVMESVLRLMNEASQRMGVDFDAGERTTEIQDEIAAKLDEAIERAAKQSHPRRRSSSRSNRDKRRMPTASKNGAGQKKGSATGQAGTDPAKSAGGEGTAEKVETATGEFSELRRGWGQLPSRERDELIQGIEEQSLDRYRDWIERYYRALQELDE